MAALWKFNSYVWLTHLRSLMTARLGPVAVFGIADLVVEKQTSNDKLDERRSSAVW